ncbi:MAG: DMT family transporter [Acidobacteriota bacterium]|nr:DMT family transporter [Acidobacteriota bacterium]
MAKKKIKVEKPTNTQNFPPILLILFAVLLWSTGGLFIKLTTLNAIHVNFGRAFFAAIVVGVFIAFRRQLKFDWFIIFVSIFYAATLTSFVYANKNTTAANAIFLQYTAPVYILIFAPLILKEKFRVTDLITVVVCLAGMSLFFLEEANAQNVLATNIFAGNIAGLVSGVCLGLYFVLLRHPRSLQFNPALSVFYGNIIIIIFMLPFILFNPQVPTTLDILAISYLGIFQIGLAYILFTYGLAKGVRSLDASIIGFVEPLLNPVWVFLFIKETPSKWAIIGGIIIIGAIVFHTLLQQKAKRRKSTTKEHEDFTKIS